MASPRTTEAIVRSIYQAFQSTDADVIARSTRELFAPDCLVVEAESLPWGGRYEGIESVVAMTQGIADPKAPIDAKNLVIDDLIVREAVGDAPAQAVAAVSFPWRGARKTIPMRALEWFTLKEGKVTEIRIFLWDTAVAVSALSAPAPGTM